MSKRVPDTLQCLFDNMHLDVKIPEDAPSLQELIRMPPTMRKKAYKRLGLTRASQRRVLDLHIKKLRLAHDEKKKAMASETGNMDVTVALGHMSGKSPVHSMPSGATAADLRKAIAESGMSTKGMKLFHDRKVLSLDATLTSQGVGHGSVVFLNPEFSLTSLKRQTSGELRRAKAKGMLWGGEEQKSLEAVVYARFVSWLKALGADFEDSVERGDHSCVDLGGLRLTRDVKENETVVHIPWRAVMTNSVAQTSTIGRAMLKHNPRLNRGHNVIAAFLIQEKRDPQSFWRPYIDLLRVPSQYDKLPIFFNPAMVELLQGSYTTRLKDARMKDYQREFKEYKTNVPQFDSFTFEEWCWARVTVITRVFGIPNGCAMVPLVDTIQHGVRTFSWGARQNGFGVSAVVPQSKGSKLSVSFGSKCNSRWFVNYGLSFRRNESFNLAQVDLSLAIPELKSSDHTNSLRLIGRCSNRDRNELPATLRALASSWLTRTRSEGRVAEDEERYHVVRGVLRDLIAMCESSLKAFSRSIEKNKRILDGADHLPTLREVDASGRSLDVSMPEHRSIVFEICPFPMGVVSIIVDYLDESQNQNIRNIVTQTYSEQEVLQFFTRFASVGLRLLGEGGRTSHRFDKLVQPHTILRQILSETDFYAWNTRHCLGMGRTVDTAVDQVFAGGFHEEEEEDGDGVPGRDRGDYR